MSFIDDIVDFGTKLFDGGVVGSLINTAIAGYTLSTVTNSITKNSADTTTNGTTSATTVDPGVKQQIAASTGNSIPVVYGEAYLGGRIFDAYMSADNTTMWFAIAISEATYRFTINGEYVGNTKFEGVYWNGQRCIFGLGGTDTSAVTALYDEGSGTTTSLYDSTTYSYPLHIYLYNRGSNYTTVVRDLWSPGEGEVSGGEGRGRPAKDIMPHWTTKHTADELVFAIVRVTYNKSLNLTGLGDVRFHIKNPLTRPGDVLWDYMLNTRYGAGLNASDVQQ